MEYIPQRGDLVWINFEPQVGHEQAGRRPAIILSPGSYNRKVGLMLCCPITSRVKGYPFEVSLPSQSPITGVILADQIKSLDWQARNAVLAYRVPESVVHEVIGKFRTLLSS